jgi:hypothetical protein
LRTIRNEVADSVLKTLSSVSAVRSARKE